MKKQNVLKRFIAAGISSSLIVLSVVPAFGQTWVSDFGETRVWYSATARNYYAGIEMETDTECDMSCSATVRYQDVYGESGTRELSAANSWGYHCADSRSSGITTYWDMDAVFEAGDANGDVFFDEVYDITE